MIGSASPVARAARRTACAVAIGTLVVVASTACRIPASGLGPPLSGVGVPMTGLGTFTIDNDVLAQKTGKSDHSYSNGIIITHAPDDEKTYEVGHKFYTPEDLDSPDRVADDRPYAGQLWGGISRKRIVRCERGRRARHQYGIRVGVVGPPSLGAEFQKFAHTKLGWGRTPQGWRHQIGIRANRQRPRRAPSPTSSPWSGRATRRCLHVREAQSGHRHHACARRHRTSLRGSIPSTRMRRELASLVTTRIASGSPSGAVMASLARM